MRKFFVAVCALSLIFPQFSFAAHGIGGGGPVCRAFSYRDDTPFLDSFTSADYSGGLLRIHLRLLDNENNNGQNVIVPNLDIFDKNCNLVTNFANLDTDNYFFTLPVGTINFSLRFTSGVHFQIWDDDHNTLISCSACESSFANPQFNSGYKASFGANNFDGTSVVNSDSFSIADPAAPVPVLIVPGLLGTEMFKDNTLLWADIPRMSENPFDSDSFMDPLAFNSDLTPSDPGVQAGDIIRDPFNLYNYTQGLISQFTDQGYTENTNLFVFPYDWRYGVSDDVVNQLQQKIQSILLQTGSGSVNVVAHSTGGLIVKKYVMDNPAANYLNKVVFVGVPNLGAPKAFKALIDGDGFSVPDLNDQEMKKISQNMPIAYDLAPSPQYETQIGDFLHVHNPFAAPNLVDQDVDYASAVQDFENQNLINNQALANSQTLHSADFDNYDIRNNGVDVYNIIGCKTGTFGKFTETAQEFSPPTYDFPEETSGDGTVPLLSAQTIPDDPSHVFFAPDVEHGKMPSADGIRQEIVNLITGSSLDTDGKILTHDAVQNNPSLCEIKGESINIKSPVAVGVTDQNGNFSGLASDGSIQNDIPGADYEVWGEHKYVFLPTDDNQQYTINLAGTGTGTFTLDDQSISNGTTTQTQVFSNLPVTPALTGTVNLGNNSATTTLTIQSTPTSSPVTIAPSSIISQAQSQDLTPPVSTSTITGLMGSPGYYRSNATITLSAIDPIVNNDPTQTSGILKTQFSLDGSATSTYQNPISVTAEGQHAISFFSTDNAGNNEQPQTVQFTIDKTAPEFAIQFSPTLQDLVFTATDTMPTVIASTSTPTKIKPRPPVRVVDADDTITATDAAGNTSQITLTAKNRKKNMKAQIQGLFYNSIPQDISATTLKFSWAFDSSGNVTALEQHVKSKKNFNIDAVYASGQTTLSGKDQSGKINSSSAGLTILRVFTNAGDFGWGE